MGWWTGKEVFWEIGKRCEKRGRGLRAKDVEMEDGGMD